MHPEMMMRNIKQYSKKVNKKIAFTIILFSAFIVLILGRMVFIQIIDNKRIEEICISQNRIIMKDRAHRGDITDRNGYIIATNILCHNLYIIRSKVQNRKHLAKEIASTGLMTYDEALNKLDSSFDYIPIYYNMPESTVNLVSAINSDAIIIKKEKIRYYNNDEVYSGIVGFVGIDNEGLEGLEYILDSELRGTDGYMQYQRKPNGKIFKHPSYKDKPAIEGKPVCLTIDSKIQQIAYFNLRNCVEQFNAKSGNVIIMDVESGEILAMANYPSYQSNLMGRGDPALCKNYSILSLYEPGSIFKLITAAAAIEYNIIKDNDIVKKSDEDSLIINGHIIKDSHESDELTFRESFTQSSNIGFVNIGNSVGKRLLYVMINAMGINKRVDIGLPGEQKGLLLNESKWIPIHQANICFGQGVSVTALQMIAAYNIVANGGYYVKPSIIKTVDNSQYQNKEKKRIIKKSTADKLNEMLVNVVSVGTGIKASVPGISIAGKTGTAEKSSSSGGYQKGRFVSSFAGYFPSENPELIMIVTIDEPRGIYWGSEVAAPLFGNIATQLLGLRQYRHLIKPVKEIQT